MSASHARASAPDAREEAAIREIAALLGEMVRRDCPAGTLARRDAHAKHHGLVRGVFRVDADVPPELRHGLFADARTYPAWIRFSNGAPHVQSDRKRDQRGMAIKLVDVPGEKVLEDEQDAPTQDFVLASCPRFFIRSVADYLPFTRAAVKAPAIRVLGFFFGWNPFRWRLHELRALLGSLGRATSPLTTRYWSQTPYRLGPLAVKYSARPLAAPPVHAEADASADFLREVMAGQLGRGPAVFEFLVQVQADPGRMPIEDSTVEWRESDAPFRRVATITIPLQRFDSDAQMALAEQLSFTPWHTRPEHAPLGGINRVRRVVYETISRLRHDLNGIVRREPRSLEIDPELITPRDGPRDAAADTQQPVAEVSPRAARTRSANTEKPRARRCS